MYKMTEKSTKTKRQRRNLHDRSNFAGPNWDDQKSRCSQSSDRLKKNCWILVLQATFSAKWMKIFGHRENLKLEDPNECRIFGHHHIVELAAAPFESWVTLLWYNLMPTIAIARTKSKTISCHLAFGKIELQMLCTSVRFTKSVNVFSSWQEFNVFTSNRVVHNKPWLRRETHSNH